MVLVSAASELSKNLLETQILRSHQRPNESKILGVGPNILCLNISTSDSDMNSFLRMITLSLQNSWLPSDNYIFSIPFTPLWADEDILFLGDDNGDDYTDCPSNLCTCALWCLNS